MELGSLTESDILHFGLTDPVRATDHKEYGHPLCEQQV